MQLSQKKTWKRGPSYSLSSHFS